MPRSKLLLIATLWIGNLLPALDATLVGTALPTIIAELEGLTLYGWIFAANLLTFTTGVPVFGKLADLYGRKPIFLAGVVIYLLGSLLSGLVQSVEQLILCRALVGLGLGAVLPAAMTILGDAFTLEERARIQWIFASAWFVSSLVGPAVGGFVTLFASWRLVFYITAPLGVGAMVLMARYYREEVERREHSIDFPGAILLAAGVVALLLALSPGNRGGSMNLGQSGGLLVLALLLLGLFVWNERRAPEPLLPLPLLLGPIIGMSVLASFLSGIVQFGASSFLPLFAQGALGGTAANAGAVLAPMTLGWPIGAGYGGYLLLRIGYRKSVLLGMGLVVLSQGGFMLLDRSTSQFLAMGAMFVLGMGFGFSSVAFMLAVQESVSWGQRGVATASLPFARSIGGSVGVAVMGALLTWHMAPLLASHDLATSGSVTSALLDPGTRAALSPGVLDQLQQALADALHRVFILTGVASLVGFGCALAFPSISHSLWTSPAPGGARATDPEPAKESQA